MTTLFYVDACILVALASTKDKQHEKVKNCLHILQKMDIQLAVSEWSFIELIRVLVKQKHFKREQAEKIAQNIETKDKLEGNTIKYIEMDSTGTIGFSEFFTYLKTQLLEKDNIHIADAIHSMIMKNNGINYILTTDNDFKTVEDITTITPDVVLGLQPK